MNRSKNMNKSSMDSRYEQVRKEVLGTRKKHWVDTKCKSNCFFVDAENLTIGLAEKDKNNSYWQLTEIKETSDTVDVAELIGVCWLDVSGEFEIANLSPETTYEVAFVIKLERRYKWKIPVNVRLILPNEIKQERKEFLEEKPREEWIKIPVGKYVPSPERTGKIKVSIYETSDEYWKSGLVIKGISIRPVNQEDSAHTKSKSFFLDAKKLSIAWAEETENNRYWRWSKIKATSNTVVKVAELIKVSSLDVSGTFETTKLSAAGTTYKVAFVMKLKESASGWEDKVNVTLTLPDGNKQERKEKLGEKLIRGSDQWIEFPVGEFVASPLRTGEIKFSICEDSKQSKEGLVIPQKKKQKEGLVIKGVAIRPMYECEKQDAKLNV